MPGESLFQAYDIAKTFGALRALDGVSLELARGEILGLVGPNGAGKSTLLKIAVGLVHPSAGSARIDGLDISISPAAARSRIGYMPGEANLYAHWQAGDFLRFCLDGYPNGDLALADSLASRFELPLKKKTREYSTGMRRKLLLIQALASGAPLLLLDEPTESLDPTSRIQVIQLLRDATRSGRAVLFSSHHLEEVEKICDRIAFLNRGKLLDSGTANAIRERASRVIRVTFSAEIPEEKLRVPGVKSLTVRDGAFFLEVEGNALDAAAALRGLPIASLEFGNARLSDLYAILYGVDS